MAFGNIGGIIAVYAFLSTTAPRFITGYAICISFACLSAVACCVYFVGCVWENRRRERMPREVGVGGYERGELGDLDPSYRYLL